MSSAVFYDPGNGEISVAVDSEDDIVCIDRLDDGGILFTFKNLAPQGIEFYWEGDRLWRPV